MRSDPRQDKKDKRATPTYSAFMEEYYFPYVRPRKRTAQKDEELFRLRLRNAFGDQKLNQITRHQIQAFHTAVREEGLAPASCDHYLKLLRHSLNLAVDWGLLLDRNPAGVKQFNGKRLANYVYLVLAGFAMMPSPSIDLSRANYDFELIQKSNQPPALV